MRAVPDKSRGSSPRVWWVAACVVLTLGVLCAVVQWGAGAAGAVIFVTVLIGISMGIMVDLDKVGLAVRLSLVAAGALLTVAAMFSVLSWSDLVLLVPLCGLAALLVTGSQRAPAGAAEPVVETVAEPWSPPLDVEAERVEVPAVPDDELCRRWRQSFTALAQASDCRVRLEVVRARQLYLDEIERRHPAELQTWLASGARAAGNPMPFLSRPPARDTSGDAPSDGRS
jgi:hypothetical protein